MPDKGRIVSFNSGDIVTMARKGGHPGALIWGLEDTWCDYSSLANYNDGVLGILKENHIGLCICERRVEHVTMVFLILNCGLVGWVDIDNLRKVNT